MINQFYLKSCKSIGGMSLGTLISENDRAMKEILDAFKNDSAVRDLYGTTKFVLCKQFVDDKGVGIIEVEVPGVKRETVDVEAIDNKVCLSYVDRSGTTREQTFPIMKGFDINTLDVVLADGLLTISVKPIVPVTKKIVIR